MSEARYSEQQVRRWLHWLARGMQSREQTILLAENLQPTWLGGTGLYLLLSRSIVYVGADLILYLCNATFFGWIEKLDPGERLDANWLAGLACVGISILICAFIESRLMSGPEVQIESAEWFSDRLFPVAVACAFHLIAFVFLDMASQNPWGSGPIQRTILAMPILNIAIAIDRSGRPLRDDIRPAEQLSWRWRSFWSGFGVGWTWMTIWVITLPVVAVWIWDWRPSAAVASAGVALLLLRAANKGVIAGAVPLKTRPNSGIWLSLKWASAVLLLMLLVSGTLAWAAAGADQYPPVFKQAIKFGAILFTPFALSRAAVFGGIAAADHFVLRMLLTLYGYAPLRFVRFLDYCTQEVGFLQKAGGGYLFMHRSLLEYFAAEEKQESALV